MIRVRPWVVLLAGCTPEGLGYRDGGFEAPNGASWVRVDRDGAQIGALTLRTRGVDTPELVLAVVRRGASGAYRGAVVSRWIEGGADLAESLAALARGGEAPDGSRVCAAWAAVGVAIGRLHAAGVLHADLNARNLLLLLA
ncbi:MAG TPA: lipopolysaccharide kinase InaA family protein, partial [Myxococcota bacterium]|nr:lipopolysaccharide kinase InaA family protein [Myxococcota bacterium]